MAISTPFETQTAIASGAITKGAGVRLTIGTDKQWIATVATSGISHGFAVNAADDKGIVNIFRQGSFGLAQAGAAISDITVPLKLTTSGYVIACTTNKDVIVAYAMETCTLANSLIQVFIVNGYYDI